MFSNKTIIGSAMAIGILLNSAVMAENPGGDTFDLSWSTIDGGAMQGSGGDFELSATIGQPDAGALTGGDFEMTTGFWFSGSNACDGSPSDAAQPEMIDEEPNAKNRFLSFSAGVAGSIQAVRVTFVSAPPPYDIWDGSELWVGSPSQVTQAGASVEPTPGFADFAAATLQCTPHYDEWASQGTINVFHEGIVPDGVYRIEVISELCDPGSGVGFSEPLEMTTATWGDTVRDRSSVPNPAADGYVNVVDALAVLEAFATSPTAIVKQRADLEPACVDLKINVSDILSSLAGFSGLPHPFTPSADDPCDSTCFNVLP